MAAENTQKFFGRESLVEIKTDYMSETNKIFGHFNPFLYEEDRD